MATLSAQTLIKAIQAVDAAVKKIAQERDEATDPELSDLEELLLSYSLAEAELKKAYEEQQGVSDNLPPYSELIP